MAFYPAEATDTDIPRIRYTTPKVYETAGYNINATFTVDIRSSYSDYQQLTASNFIIAIASTNILSCQYNEYDQDRPAECTLSFSVSSYDASNGRLYIYQSMPKHGYSPNAWVKSVLDIYIIK